MRGHVIAWAMAGLAVIVSESEPAKAQDQPSQTQSVQFLEDADSAANQWVQQNPRGIAVAIRLGAGTPVPVARIESTLRSDFRAHGIHLVRFFYERGGDGGSSVAYQTRNHAWGPFGLAVSRDKVAEAAAQHLFELRRGLN